MSTLPELRIIYAITQPVGKGEIPSIEPLVRYLLTAKALSPDFCKFLAGLIDPDGVSPYRFTYGRRDNRRMLASPTVDRHVDAYQRVQELDGEIATKATCAAMMSASPEWSVRLSAKEAAFAKHSVVAFRISLNKPISKNNAVRVAAAEFNLSLSTLKRVIAEVDEAQRDTGA